MGSLSKKLITVALSLAIVISLIYVNRISLMTWAATQGAMGFLATLVEPILPTQPVDWQTSSPAQASTTDRPPNIIVILADDLGWNDTSFYGGGVGGGAVQTPNIDRIAAEGVHFSNGYAGNATCAPSRAALLTGRYPTRYGFEFTPAPAQMMRMAASFESHREEPHPGFFLEENLAEFPPLEEQGVPASEIFLPELLADRGYHSMILGKWHLGQNEGHAPNDQGFDEFLGFLSGAAMFAEFDDPTMVKSIQAFDAIDQFLWPNLTFAVRYNKDQHFAPDEYMTDYLSTQAVRAIEANQHRPFFMYLSYNAPHTPLHAKQSDYDALPMISNHTERVYGAMIVSLDRGIGRVLAALEDAGIDDNTLIIFSSDNGGAHYVGLPDLNAPYRGWKMTFFEGGTHVPFFMRWPDRIEAGSEYQRPVTHIDIFSTAAAAASVEVPTDREIDGVDLLPYVNGAVADDPHEAIFWRTGTYRTVRSGDWKLQLSDPAETPFLYNLAVDPTEQHNLAASEPEQLHRLKRLIETGMSDWAVPVRPPLVRGPNYPDKHLNEPLDETDVPVYWYN
ncbi:MAG: sulfatase-like hydrolase/transferase [Pseudomonadales bacterium]|jgi:arylsulfatase A-like enzyme|nr:sulfatase-like hydrolase/transferase [Pseudomonadales bacterium]|tara:strand:+ start:1316 stop:3001 length:1686 start_codon:yes stop_codon:yes gene_type:complete